MRFSILKKDGFQKNIVSPENSDLKFLSFSYLYTDKNFSLKENTEKKEWLWVLLSGKMRIEIKGMDKIEIQRKNVFEEKPASVYIPPEIDYSLETYSATEAIAVSSHSEKIFYPALILPDNIKVQRAGKLNYQRTIYNILTQNFSASRLIAGETIHDKSHWSCFPPHKHDVDEMPVESNHEEIYFFKVSPEKTGFGMMRVYDNSQDVAFPILSNDVITIPSGYHPVAVIPEHILYYFWALAGEKRPFQRHTHPDYLEYE